MTVTTSEASVQFDGDGSTVLFPFSFKVLNESDLTVILTNTTTDTVDGIPPGESRGLVQNSDYTVSLTDPGGEVDLSKAGAPATGLRVVIQRTTSPFQTTDYVSNDPFPADSHERALDRSALREQELNFTLDRAIKFQPGDSPSISTFLPLKNLRKNTFLGFDADGELAALSELDSTTTVTAYISTLLDDQNAGEARSTLGVLGKDDQFIVTSGTSSSLTASITNGPVLDNGLSFVIEPHTDVDADATLDYNGNGALPLVVADSLNGGADNTRKVNSGELYGGLRYQVSYDGGNSRWLVLTGVSLGGLTKNGIANPNQSNTFEALQTFATGTADDSNGIEISGSFTNAHNHRIVQNSPGTLAFKDTTSGNEWATYDGDSDTLNVKAGSFQKSGASVLTQDGVTFEKIGKSSISTSTATFNVTVPSGYEFVRIWFTNIVLDQADDPFVYFLNSSGNPISGSGNEYNTSLFGTRAGGTGTAGSEATSDILLNGAFENVIPNAPALFGYLDVFNARDTSTNTLVSGYNTAYIDTTRKFAVNNMMNGLLDSDNTTETQEITGIQFNGGNTNSAQFTAGNFTVLGFKF